MNKNDLINHVFTHTGLSREQSAKAVDALFNNIALALKNKNHVRIARFGIFLVVERNQRKGWNFQRGEVMDLPAIAEARFKPSDAFRARLQGD